MQKNAIPHQVLVALFAITLATRGSGVEAFTVTGQARARGADALAGATVSLLPLTEPGKRIAAEPPQPMAVVTTKGDGTFRLSTEQPDFYRLRVEAPGFVPVETSLAPLLDDVQLPDLELAPEGLAVQTVPKATLVAAAPPRFLTGRLVSALKGAAVRHGLIWSADQPAFFTRSDEQGKFTLALPETGSRRIEAAAPGFARKQLTISAKPGSPLQIALDPVISLAGKVIEPSGRPVAEAEIQAFLIEAPLRAVARCSSNAAGVFKLSGLAADRGYRIEARHAGYGTIHRDVRRAVAAPHRSEPGALIFVLQPGRAAFGAIRDRAAEPVSTARVSLVPLDAEGMPPLSVVADQEGAFHFAAVPPGSFALLVKASGFAPLTLPGLVIPAGAEPWDLGTAFLESGAVIEGRVVEKDGSAVPGAQVRVVAEEDEKGRSSPEVDLQVTTDEDGRFALLDQLAGTPCRLEVSAPGFIPVLSSQVVPPTPEPITITLAPSCQVSGTVLAEGSPVAGAVIEAAMDDGTLLSGRRFFTVSEGDGHFLLQDVAPGSLILSASAEGYADSRQLKLALPPGQRREGIELHLEAGGTVSGTVSSRAGSTVEGAVIEALAEGNEPDAPAPSRRTATTDRAGHFRLAGLKPGPWHFSASHPKFPRKVSRRRIDKGDLTLDFVLEAGSDLAGTVTDEAGAPLAGARVLLSQAGGGSPGIDVVPLAQWREAISQADGSFRFAGVEDGSYRLRAAHAGFAAAESPESIAVAGSPVEGTILRLQRASSIIGRLLGLSYSQLTLLEVSAFQADGRSARGEIEPTGGYHILDLAPGDWYVVAEVEETGERAIGQVLVGEEPASLVLDFASGNLIERPRDDRSGKPQPLAVEQNQPSRPFSRPRF